MNPEILRHAWADLTVRRLIGMPVVLALVIGSSWIGHYKDATQTLQVAAGLMGLIGAIWGGHLAAGGVLGAINAGTWDSQRMTRLSAWQVTLGKLFGPTLFPWYGVLVCGVYGLLVAAVDGGPLAQRMPALVVHLICLSLFVQTMSFFISLMMLRNAEGQRRIETTWCLLLSLASASVFLVGIVPWSGRVTVPWYGIHVTLRDLAWIGQLVLSLWAVLGCWRVLRQELQEPAPPRVWPLFVATLVAIALGFGPMGALAALPEPAASTAAPALYGFWVLMGLTYVAAYLEPRRRQDWERLWRALVRRDVEGALRAAPLFWWPGVLALLAVPFVLLQLPRVLGLPLGVGEMHSTVPAQALFMIRDLALLHLFTLRGQAWRGRVATSLVLALLYTVLPFTLERFDVAELSPAFLPVPSDDFVLAVGVPAIQAIVVLLLLVLRHAPRSLPVLPVPRAS